MRALVLAGGFGTRLRPLTFTRPKHLLPIANVPHIDHVMTLLLRHGIEDVVLLTSYLADAFADVTARAENRGMSLQTTLEPEPLGTAGAFKNAQDHVGDEAFVAFNGDVLTTVDLGRVIEWHRARGAEATIVLHEVDDPSAFGTVPTDDDGKVLGFIEKPAPGEAVTNLINAGIYVFEPSVLDRIPGGRPWSAEHQLFPQLVEDGTLYAVSDDDAYWLDIGTPDKYREANLDALRGRFGEVVGAGKLLGPGTDVAGDAEIELSCLGAGCVVASGARVAESVLLPGVVVGRDAVVSRSVLGEGVAVTPGAVVEDAAVGDGETIGSAARSREA